MGLRLRVIAGGRRPDTSIRSAAGGAPRRLAVVAPTGRGPRSAPHRPWQVACLTTAGTLAVLLLVAELPGWRAPLAVSAPYRNCAAARAAGAAPLRRGEPGYGLHLDRDRDGIACEIYGGDLHSLRATLRRRD